jgi:hypothetical protein
MTRRDMVTGASAMVATLATASVQMAQTQPGGIRSLLAVTIKPGREDDFRAAILAEVQALNKLGHKRAQTWWQSWSGPAHYVLVRRYASFVERAQVGQDRLDASVQAARRRALDCVSEQRVEVDREVPGLVQRQANGKLPEYIRALRTELRMSSVTAYKKVLAEEMFPHVAKDKNRLVLVTELLYGAAPATILTITGMATAASLDEPLPLPKALGEQKYQLLLEKLTPMVIRNETQIYKHAAELSYTPAS